MTKFKVKGMSLCLGIDMISPKSKLIRRARKGYDEGTFKASCYVDESSRESILDRDLPEELPQLPRAQRQTKHDQTL